MLSDDRRREIAAFLRSRRERLQPEDVGLARGPRRRTPGLRREEVASMSGMSTEWYTWLEQAREVQPSADALRRLADVLRLQNGETQHLLTLAGYGASALPATGNRPDSVSPRLRRLLDTFGNCPAWVHGERWDFLAWNRAATLIHGDLDAMQGIERNGVYRLFLQPRARQMLVDWELHARDVVAKLRAAHARNVDDGWFNELVTQLRSGSPEFSRWWNDHDVQLPQGGTKRYRHPDAGTLTFDYTMMQVAGEAFGAVHMVTYVPANPATREKVALLLKETEAAPAAGKTRGRRAAV
ncbi:MAG TPA: helix-turn-helix transcriptional regulator [Gammaproteobacteria bacterium]